MAIIKNLEIILYQGFCTDIIESYIKHWKTNDNDILEDVKIDKNLNVFT